MAQPASRSDLINYCKRQLGAPVLEVNVADEQIDDLIDDALQYFHERHYDGVVQTFLKYKITEADVNRGRTRGNSQTVGIVTTTASSTIDGSSVTFSFEENSNYLQVPSQVIGINKIFRYDGSQTVTNNMFSVKYQMFLNDIYYFSSTEVLTYAMTKRYLEDMDFALNTEKQIRFNQRQDRLYLDVDWSDVTKDDYLIIDCYRLLDPNDFSRVWNDSFLERYVTQLIKRQWGQNLLKFRGAKLPGGIELNGRELYEDAERELEDIKQRMALEYELPPYDFIG